MMHRKENRKVYRNNENISELSLADRRNTLQLQMASFKKTILMLLIKERVDFFPVFLALEVKSRNLNFSNFSALKVDSGRSYLKLT